MAITYKCFGQTNDNAHLALFNGRKYKVLASLVKQLKEETALDCEKVIIEKTEIFPSGEKSVLWPMGQKTHFSFDVVNGCIDTAKMDKIFRNGR
ncbi:MAG: hypothetical protein IKP24_03785 [Alphaproteobacteria bacterium]|nr:hypothetical protein [Alphaproteobacteria bacterium]